MRSATALGILVVGVLGIMLAGAAQGKPPYATGFDNSCEACHTKDLVLGKMQVSDTGFLTDLGTQLNGKIRGPLKTFSVQAGNIVTLSVDVLDGNDKFAAQLKRLEKGGQANDEINVLIWSEANSADNVWTRQEAGNPPYFTKDDGNGGGISGSVTPATYTFDLLVDAATPPDFYDLEFAAAGPIAGLGKWYQDEHFYLEVVSPPNAAVIRGGSMYDKWWAVTGAAAPTTDHPLWASRPDTASNTRSGADTWRCKECHGWDYKGVNGVYAGGSHRTGIAGIFGTAKTAQAVFDLLKTDHGYGAAGLSDEDISDLAAFVTEGLIDTDSILDADGAFIGDVATGQVLYDSGIGTNIDCAACHGQLGLTPPPGHPDFDAYVGLLSNENPWEFQHKVQFGHPATAMPSSVAGGGTIQDVADLGAYSQRLPQAPTNEAVVRGGSMYDKWWAVTGAAAPTTDHPLWASRPDAASNSRSGADTWRCKECHGWDYKGADGAYAGGSHRTGIAGIFGTTKTTQEVFDLLKTDHAYGAAGLSDEDISDLAAFVIEGLIDTDSVMDANGTFIGDVAMGQTLYDSGIGTNISCAACHGQLGLTPPPGHPDFDAYVGLLSNENPWEFQHKVQFGHPATAMPSSVAGGGTIPDVADLGAYSQTLPQEPVKDAPVVRGGSMYDKWWAVTGAAAPTTDHPLWASRPDAASNSRSGADTWRCKECHGWDYKGADGAYAGGSHRTGIAGIFGTTKTAQEVFDLLKTDHAYGAAGLSDEDISDLAAFVTEGLIDADNILDADGAFIGDVATGQVLYDSGIGTNISCAACHGQLGLTPPPGHPDFDAYVGLLSNENPWEFQHKVQFGHPATAMPSSVAGGGTILDVADLGAYSQTLPQEPIAEPAVVRGGLMYDKWWAVTGAAAPTTDHPLWASRPDAASNSRSGADTWRCKECHGWDYKGVNGTYAGGSHRTGIAGIFGTTKTTQEVFDLLKTGHGYGTAGLTDEDISDLAAFVTEGLIDTDSIIDVDGVFTGDVATGQTLYDFGIGTNIGCAACHGQLGLTPPPGSPDFGDFPGKIANENPWEFQHKVRFGQPATAMPSSVAGGGTILDVADLGTYSQTLPQAPAP